MPKTVVLNQRQQDEISDTPLSQISDDEKQVRKKSSHHSSRSHTRQVGLGTENAEDPSDEDIVPNSTAYVIPGLPPLPRLTSTTNWEGVETYAKVKISKTVEKALGAKGKELINTANERIEAMCDSCDGAVRMIGEVEDEAATLLSDLHQKTREFHKDLVKALKTAASEKNKTALAKQNLASYKSDLTKANKQIKTHESKIGSLEREKAILTDKLKEAKETTASANAATRGRGDNMLSPRSMLKEKSQIRVDEHRKKLEQKQELQERDRKHAMKMKKDRASSISGNLLSLSNNGFVSCCVFDLFIFPF